MDYEIESDPDNPSEYYEYEEYECEPYTGTCETAPTTGGGWSVTSGESDCKSRKEEITEELGQLEEKITSLWSLYEEKGLDVFMLSNIDIVANIIESLSPSLTLVRYAKELFDKIMQRLQRGIHMDPLDKPSLDRKKLADTFTVFGEAIARGSPHAQTSICSILGIWIESLICKRQTLLGIIKPNNPYIAFTRKLMEYSNSLTVMIPDEDLVTAFEQSHLPQKIAKQLRDDPHTEGFFSILSLLKTLCDVSSTIRERLWCLPILDPILLKLAEADPSYRVLHRVTDFMLSYFEATPTGRRQISKNDGTTHALRKEPFQILLMRLIRQMSLRCTKSWVSIRNDLAFLVCLITQQVPCAGEYFGDFGLLIAAIVSNGILQKQVVDPAFKIECNLQDLELLQYLIYMLQCFIEKGCGEKIINEYSIPAVLLRLTIGPCELVEDKARKDDLDKVAWSTIQAIAKHCPLSLLTPHGVPSLLSFLKEYGEAGEGDQSVLAMSLQTLRIMLTSGGTSTKAEAANNDDAEAAVANNLMDYFIQLDVMPILLSVLKQLATKGNDDSFQDTCISNALHSCAALGFYDLQQKELFGSLEGVSTLVQLMAGLYRSCDRRRRDSAIQISISECVCGCVAYCPNVLEKFFVNEGILRLLEIVEVSEGPVAPAHLMNCVLHVCNYKPCMEQLLSWNRPFTSANKKLSFGYDNKVMAGMILSGADFDLPQRRDSLHDLYCPTDQSLAAVLCSLWRDDERRAEVLRDTDGCIASLSNPLMSKFARSYERGEQTGILRSCLDVTLVSLRAKIYLLMNQIVAATESEEALFEGLSLKNQIAIESIVNFAELKKSEIYLEVIEEMQNQGFELVSSAEDTNADGGKLFQIAKDIVAAVLESQQCLIRLHKEKGTMNEYEFYHLLKNCCLQDHLTAARDIDYLARTTNYRYLVEKRLWQKTELEAVEKELNASFVKKGKLHRTSDGFLNITTWSIRTKVIESEPKISTEVISLDDYEDNERKEAAEAEGDTEGKFPLDVPPQEDSEEEEELEETHISASPSGFVLDEMNGTKSSDPAVANDTEN